MPGSVDDSEAFLRAATKLSQQHHKLVVVGAICGGDMTPNVGIIALTVLEGDAYRRAVLAAGADDLVYKAELVTDLLPAIQRVTQTDRSR